MTSLGKCSGSLAFTSACANAWEFRHLHPSCLHLRCLHHVSWSHEKDRISNNVTHAWIDFVTSSSFVLIQAANEWHWLFNTSKKYISKSNATLKDKWTTCFLIAHANFTTCKLVKWETKKSTHILQKETRSLNSMTPNNISKCDSQFDRVVVRNSLF